MPKWQPGSATRRERKNMPYGFVGASVWAEPDIRVAASKAKGHQGKRGKKRGKK